MQIYNDPAMRTYLRRILFATIGYILSLMAASLLIPDGARFNLFYLLLALIPALFAVGFIWAIARLIIDQDDEFLRLLEIRKTLIATALTLAIASILGIIELYVAIPPLPLFFIFPIWCLGLFVGQFINWLNYRDKETVG